MLWATSCVQFPLVPFICCGKNTTTNAELEPSETGVVEVGESKLRFVLKKVFFFLNEVDWNILKVPHPIFPQDWKVVWQFCSHEV